MAKTKKTSDSVKDDSFGEALRGFVKKVPFWVKISAISLVALIAILGAAGSVVAYSYSNKVFPKTSLLGQNLGGQTLVSAETQVDQLSNQIASTPLTFSYNEMTSTLSLSELNVEVDSSSIKQAISNNQGAYDYLKPIYWYDFFRPKALSFQAKTDEESIKAKIYESFKFPDTPTDANLKIENGQIAISEEKIGQIISVTDILEAINKIALTATPQELALSTQESLPVIRTQLASETKSTIEAAVKPIKLQADGFSYTIPASDQINWIDVSAGDNKFDWTYNKDKIAVYLESIKGKLNRGMVQRVIMQETGAVSKEGSIGRSVDINDLAQKVYETITETPSDTPVVNFSFRIIQITDKIIGPGYIAGMFPGKYIDVNLKKQVLYLMNGTTMEAEFRVSTGKWSMQTPIGTYTITKKDPRAYSATYKLYMPYWMSFIGNKYGVHELPEWPGGMKEGESHLGTPVSHGCIRLGIGSAKTVYDWTEIGTPINIHKD